MLLVYLTVMGNPCNYIHHVLKCEIDMVMAVMFINLSNCRPGKISV